MAQLPWLTLLAMSMLKSTSATAAVLAGGNWHTHNPRPAHAQTRADRSFKNYFAKKAYTGSGSWSSIG
jgi:hypothetical protein